MPLCLHSLVSRISPYPIFFISRVWHLILLWLPHSQSPLLSSNPIPQCPIFPRKKSQSSNLTLQAAVNQRKLSVEDQSIVILDFGSQYTQLIARRIRELKVFSAVLPCNATLEEIKGYRPAGIILSGGP